VAPGRGPRASALRVVCEILGLLKNIDFVNGFDVYGLLIVGLIRVRVQVLDLKLGVTAHPKHV